MLSNDIRIQYHRTRTVFKERMSVYVCVFVNVYVLNASIVVSCVNALQKERREVYEQIQLP